jgi:hypothetical protein
MRPRPTDLHGYKLCTLHEGFVAFHDVAQSIGVVDNAEILMHAFRGVGYAATPIQVQPVLALYHVDSGQYYRLAEDSIEAIFLLTPSLMEEQAERLRLAARRGGTRDEQLSSGLSRPHKYVEAGGTYSVHFGKEPRK